MVQMFLAASGTRSDKLCVRQDAVSALHSRSKALHDHYYKENSRTTH
jgi:hypothetical protein